MNRFLVFLFYVITSLSVFSQSRPELSFRDKSLERVLEVVEKKFDVKYSYADSLLIGKKIILPQGAYELFQVHAEIEKQTNLTITAISNRYYSITSTTTVINAEPIPLREVHVDTYLTHGIIKKDQAYQLLPQKIGSLPGIPDSDVFLTLHQLPGVTNPNETASGIYVRGGTPDQNQVLFDGIRVFHPGHLFGMISGINSEVVKTVKFYDKSIHSRYGESVSGLIELETAAKNSTEPHFTVGTTMVNATVVMQQPLIKNKLDILLSGRKSLTEFYQSYPFTQMAQKTFQNTDFSSFDTNNTFRFYDLTAKLIYRPQAKTLLTFTALDIDNELDYTFMLSNNQVSNQDMNSRNNGFSLTWEHYFSDKLKQKTVAYYSFYTFDYNKKNELEADAFEAFKKRNRIISSGGDVNFNWKAANNTSVDFGYQIRGNDVSHLFNSFNAEVAIDLNLYRFYNIVHSVYLQYNLTTAKWLIKPGLRYDYFTKIGTSGIQPRLFIERKISESFSLQFAYDRKLQYISQVKEQAANDLSLENYVWVLADNANYPILKSNQFTLGALFRKKYWLIDADVFYKKLDGIAAFNLGPFLPESLRRTQGKEVASGFNFLVQRMAKSWRATAGYGFQDVQVKLDNFNQNRYFLSNTNIRHSVHFTVAKSINRFSGVVGWFWHTGKPYSNLTSTGEILTLNEDNLENYHRLDVTLDYSFIAQKTRIKAGISLYNVYDRKTVLSLEYERKYAGFSDLTQPRYEKQYFYSLGFTPNVFVKVNF